VSALEAQGIEVLHTQVSQVLAKMGMKKKRRRRKAAAVAPAATSTGLNINDLVAAKKVVGEVGSIAKVKEALAALARLR
jgi:arginine repressor